MDFNQERYIRGADKTKAESYEAKLREMDDRIDDYQKKDYDKRYPAEYKMYDHLVYMTRLVCSEIVQLNAKRHLSPEDKKTYDRLQREYNNLTTQEFEKRVFFRNVKSNPTNEPEAIEPSEPDLNSEL